MPDFDCLIMSSNSVTAQYTLTSATTVDVHNYANHDKVNGRVSDSGGTLQAVIKDPDFPSKLEVIKIPFRTRIRTLRALHCTIFCSCTADSIVYTCARSGLSSCRTYSMVRTGWSLLAPEWMGAAGRSLRAGVRRRRP